MSSRGYILCPGESWAGAELIWSKLIWGFYLIKIFTLFENHKTPNRASKVSLNLMKVSYSKAECFLDFGGHRGVGSLSSALPLRAGRSKRVLGYSWVRVLVIHTHESLLRAVVLFKELNWLASYTWDLISPDKCICMNFKNWVIFPNGDAVCCPK